MDFLSEQGKLIIEDKGGSIGNDLAVGTERQMEKEYGERIIRHAKGSFIMDPLIGAGIAGKLNGPQNAELAKRRVVRSLKADDFTVHGIAKVQDESDLTKYTIAVNATRRVD